jgi:uncharacterized protein YoaH (UPF0181 family)
MVSEALKKTDAAGMSSGQSKTILAFGMRSSRQFLNEKSC